MRVVATLCVFLVAAGTANADHAVEVTETLKLDLTNWGLGIFYIDGTTLATESNGHEGWQDVPTLTLDGETPGDAQILP